MKKSIVRRSTNVSDNLPTDIHPVLRRIYANRNIDDANVLEKSLSKLLPFHDLKNIDCAVELLYIALQEQESLLIIGD